MNRIKSSLLSVTLLSSTVFAAPYTITDLGELADITSFAKAINNNGTAVGDFVGSIDDVGIREFATHAFSYDGSTFVDLGTLEPDFPTLSSSVRNINDMGQIIGFGHVNESEVEDEFLLGIHAFIYENEQMVSLGLPIEIEANYSSALDINNAGIIVGFAGTQFDLNDEGSGFLNQEAVIIDPDAEGDKFTVLGSLGDPDVSKFSAARSINEQGQIVGWSQADEVDSVVPVHAFYIDPLGTNMMEDAGTLGGISSSPKAINNLGIMVGRSHLEDTTVRAFMFDIADANSMVNLGTLFEEFPGSLANAINDSNQVVGSSVSGKIPDPTLPVEPIHAVLFENNDVIDLNTQIDCSLGWTLSVANDINNAGQIVGSGLINGETHGFLLTPDPNGGAAESCTEDPTSEAPSSGGSIGLTLFLLLLTGVIRQRLLEREPLTSESSS